MSNEAVKIPQQSLPASSPAQQAFSAAATALNAGLVRIEAMSIPEDAKKAVRDTIAWVAYERKRRANGLSQLSHFGAFHMLVTGQREDDFKAYTREIAGAYHEAEILPSDRCAHFSPADFTASYVGQSVPRAHKLFEEARGGVIVLHNLGQLVRLRKGYGGDLISEIISSMDAFYKDTMFVFAGAAAEAEELLKADKGLRARLRDSVDLGLGVNKPEMLDAAFARIEEMSLPNKAAKGVLQQAISAAILEERRLPLLLGGEDQEELLVVARAVAAIYRDSALVPRENCIVADVSSLKDARPGHTTMVFKAKLARAEGGVAIITGFGPFLAEENEEEKRSLAETLAEHMQKGAKGSGVILAGRTADLKVLMGYSPVLQDIFESRIDMDDTPAARLAVKRHQLQRKSVKLTPKI